MRVRRTIDIRVEGLETGSINTSRLDVPRTQTAYHSRVLEYNGSFRGTHNPAKQKMSITLLRVESSLEDNLVYVMLYSAAKTCGRLVTHYGETDMDMKK